MFISALQKISGHHRSDLLMGIFSLGKERKVKSLTHVRLYVTR